MSYLDLPRVHFSGTFFTNPSTLDNTPSNYDPANANNLIPLWNQFGMHHFKFENCKITAAVIDASGALKTSPNDDPIIGGKVVEVSPVYTPSNLPAPPKLVDLDPEWQNSSQIYGMTLSIEIGSGQQIEGTMDVATLRDLWMTRKAGAGPGTANASGGFQSVLRNLVSKPTGPVISGVASKWLNAGLLSLRFVTYAYKTASTSGKVVGTIGLGVKDEPNQFLNARRLEPSNPNLTMGPRTYFGAFGPAPFRLDEKRKRLIIDLGNAIPETTPGGARPAVGVMKARVTPAAGAAVDLGVIDYSQAHYEITAGVEELAVTDAQIATLKSRPLQIMVDGPPPTVILSERPTGTNIETTDPTFRLNPGELVTFELYATAFGVPKAGQVINARLTTGGARTAAGLTFTVLGGGKTDAKGRVLIQFTASDPGKVRLGGKLDGQLYLVELDWGKATAPAAPDWRNRIVGRVFDTRAAVAKPKWADVKDIFAEFALLYPIMKGFVDLSDMASVQAKKDQIDATLKYNETDPRYMPVSRDLSRDKRSLILRWIADKAPS